MPILQSDEMAGAALKPSQSALIGIVILVWASNYIVVAWALERYAPLSLCAWRFAAAFVPACFFVRPPQGRWALLACFGALTGIGQFGLLYVALRGHITPGLASVINPTQAFFNVALGALVLREPIRRIQFVGCAVACAGLVLIVVATQGSATILGVTLVLLSGLSWAGCNTLLRRYEFNGDLLAFMIWSSPFAAIPLLILSAAIEGVDAVLAPVLNPDWTGAAIIGWQAYANSIFGYSIWNGLIREHGLARIAPLALFVPVVALVMAAALLGEVLDPPKLAGAALIIVGVLLPLWRSRVTTTS